MTLEDCLDLLADPSRRAYDIPWRSVQPGAAQTNLGDYLPQLIAAALEIRIVLFKAAAGPCETVGARDSFGRLLAAATREVMIVQDVRQNHWDAALPLVAPAPPPLPPSAAAAAAAVLPSALPPITTAEEKQEEKVKEKEEEEEAAPAHRGRRVFADQQQGAKEPPAYAASQSLLRQQLEEDARVAAKEVAKKTRRIDELVASLQVTHEDHMQRTRPHGRSAAANLHPAGVAAIE
jgi:hypothetical protein